MKHELQTFKADCRTISGFLMNKSISILEILDIYNNDLYNKINNNKIHLNYNNIQNKRYKTINEIIN